MNTKLSSSPASIEFIPPYHLDEKVYEKAEPIILTEPKPDMKFIDNTIIVYQYPPDDKLFVPTYISAEIGRAHV